METLRTPHGLGLPLRRWPGSFDEKFNEPGRNAVFGTLEGWLRRV